MISLANLQLTTLTQWQAIIMLCAVFGLLLAAGEFMHRKLAMNAEYARKFIHVSVGLVCVFNAHRFTNHWYVLGAVGVFFLVLLANRKKKVIASLHSMKRKSYGELLLPVTIYLSFLLYKYYHFHTLFLLPLLMVSISDPAAFFGGTYFKKGKKSVQGTLTFFVTAFITSFFLLKSLGTMSWGAILLLATVCAVLGALVESISLNGSDNITVPVTIGGILVVYVELIMNHGIN